MTSSKKRKLSQSSRFCACPMCGKTVMISLVSVHMDSAECGAEGHLETVSHQQFEETEDSRSREGVTDAHNHGFLSSSVKLIAAAERSPHATPSLVKESDIGDQRDCSSSVVDNSQQSQVNEMSKQEGKESAEVPGCTFGVAQQWPIRDSTPAKKPKIDNSVPCFEIPLYQTISEGPPGQVVVLDFISELEEAQILRAMEADVKQQSPTQNTHWRESTFNGLHVSQAWGVKANLKRRVVEEGDRPMPSWSTWVTDRWQQTIPFLRHFAPNECNAIDYRRARGHWLQPHCDDRQLSTDVLVNLSMAGDAVMTYTRDTSLAGNLKPGSKSARMHGPGSYRVRLLRRSLQIQTGSCRYDFMHGIPRENLLDDRRVSVTFRFSPLTTTPGSKGSKQ